MSLTAVGGGTAAPQHPGHRHVEGPAETGTSFLLPTADQRKMHKILEKDRSSGGGVVSPCSQQSLDDSSPGQNIQLQHRERRESCDCVVGQDA